MEEGKGKQLVSLMLDTNMQSHVVRSLNELCRYDSLVLQEHVAAHA